MIHNVSDTEFSFDVWTPLTKGREANDDDRLLFGVASAGTKDQQGEIVIQKGIETEPLLKRGKINWNHQDKYDPSCIIGKPTEAALNKEGDLAVAGRLYKGMKHNKAEYVWELAKYYDEHPDDGGLGWSLQGLGMRKGNVVVKTICRHLAITHDPAQTLSWASIAKAMIDGYDCIGPECFCQLEKTMTNGASGALLKENLDSGQLRNLLDYVFLNKSHAAAPYIWTPSGQYQGGVRGLFRQLVATGLTPKDAREFLTAFRKATRVTPVAQ